MPQNVVEINKIKILFAKKEEVIKQISKLLSSSNTRPCQVVTLNSLIYLQTKFDYTIFKAVKDAALVLPDSLGIIMVGFLLTGKKFSRITGVDVVCDIFKLAHKKGYKLFLLGSRQQVVEKVKLFITKRYSVEVVGVHHGYFDPDDESIIERINIAEPDILLVGLPAEPPFRIFYKKNNNIPIQEKWVYKNLAKLKTKLVIGIGGSFDVLSGELSRAPKFFQILGLEWYYRFLQQPWRIIRLIKLPLAMMFLIIDVITQKFCFHKK